jgi:tripeptide aminopeptidase
MTSIIKEFLELVKINSNTKNERAMADCLKEKLRILGCQVTEDDAGSKIGGTAGNLYAVFPGTLPGSILLTAHMDRVPNGENIVAVINKDVITSDGNTILAADDLSGVCAILDCLRRLKDSDQGHCTVEILFTVSEEKGQAGSRNLDYTAIKSKVAYVFDSSGRIGRIINTAPSKATVTIEIHGKNAHAGNEPEKGIDAAKAAGILLATLPIGRLGNETTSNFPIITTNATSTNVVCDYAKIIGEARSSMHRNLEDYLQHIQDTATKTALETGATINVECNITAYAFQIKPDSAIIQNAVSAMSALGIMPNITLAHCKDSIDGSFGNIG